MFAPTSNNRWFCGVVGFVLDTLASTRSLLSRLYLAWRCVDLCEEAAWDFTSFSGKKKDIPSIKVYCFRTLYVFPTTQKIDTYYRVDSLSSQTHTESGVGVGNEVGMGEVNVRLMRL